MPYIRKEQREIIDPLIEALAKKINGLMELSGSYEAGLLNYVITKILIKTEFDNGVRYARINEVMGVLECVKQEIYRRKAASYEDEKAKENGDVF
jgi:hypothetical protein